MKVEIKILGFTHTVINCVPSACLFCLSHFLYGGLYFVNAKGTIFIRSNNVKRSVWDWVAVGWALDITYYIMLIF